ncbi:MAG: hypothetical protein H6Q89_3097 [Myxococcaceae bacterium]|nr:hypothetical protein [Myxococcaceae bacterium]
MFVTRPLGRIAILLALLVGSSAFAQRTLWLVRPLYPGQEALVERTEKALDRLIPAADRSKEIIGSKELAASLRGKVVADIPCLSADSRCADPIDPYVASLGFDRVVLIQGGQDEAGFKFRVVSYRPATREVTPATASNAILEKALLGAVAKVVPVASSLDVKTNPPGATVYIDDVKVGVTPLSTQVLPGERLIRLDLKLHQPIEETLVIPVRGAASLEKNLQKVAARIVITASPAGTSIAVDGQMLGKDKVDRGILPGEHTIRLTAEGHKDFEQQITVKAEEQYQLDKTLEPIPGLASADPKKINVTVKNDVLPPPDLPPPPPPPPAPPPPPPPTETELTYMRGAYFHASFEGGKLEGNRLVARRFGDNGLGRTEYFTTPGRNLYGAAIEYGVFGKYIGLAVIGVSFLTNADPMGISVGVSKDTPATQAQEQKDGVDLPSALSPVSAKLLTIRAIQPQVRIAAWKFQFGLQAGFEFRVGHVVESAVPAQYKDGFLVLDLLASARVNVRFYIYEGFFMFGQYNYTWFVYGEQTRAGVQSAGTMGFNLGLGYAF